MCSFFNITNCLLKSFLFHVETTGNQGPILDSEPSYTIALKIGKWREKSETYKIYVNALSNDVMNVKIL